QETEALQKLDGSVKSQFASQKKEVEQIVAKSQAEIIKQETEALQKLDGSVKSQFASQKKEVEQIVAKSQAEIIKQETEALQKLDSSVKAQFTEQAKAIQQQDAVMKEQFANQKKEVDLTMAKMLEQLQQLPSSFATLQTNLLQNVGQIIATEISRLETEMNAQLQAEQQKVVSQVKRLNAVDPKLIDKCVSRGDFDLLQEIIVDPNVDKKMLCLIHWADRFTENKVELEKQGVIFSLEALQTAIEEHLRLPSYDSRGRHHLKRLLNGCHQVLLSWQQNQLQNSIVKKELDNTAIQELLLIWQRKTDAGDPMPHVSMYTQELVRQEADGWFKQELETARQNELDAAITKSIWSKWKVNSNGKDLLSLEMKHKIQQVLVKHFHEPGTQDLPQAVKDAANEETICELICDNLKQRKLDIELSKYISSKTKEISDEKYKEGELFISNEAIVNDVVQTLYQEWLSNHAIFELAGKIDVQVGIVLYEAFDKMDGMGSIRENINKEALQLLLVEFRENKLSEDVRVEMENHIRNHLISRLKLTDAEKMKVLQRLLDDWKSVAVSSSDILNLQVLMPHWNQQIECLNQHLRAPYSGMFKPVAEVRPSTSNVVPESVNTLAS
ncbi:MAG: hypothetical protein JSS53_06330, partial [Proteobacteria bacterium]|nr:hypothetical protein [Pseudomonadota bacterium]